MPLKTIASQLGIAVPTLNRYIKIGVSAGWCSHTDNERKILSKKYIGVGVAKKVCVYDASHNLLHEFKSINSCLHYMRDNYPNGFGSKQIKNSCEKKEPYHGFFFEYIK